MSMDREIPPLVLALHAHASSLARRIATALGGQARVAPPRPAEIMRDAFAAGQPLVGICATGILIRALAPLLAHKRAEPAVVAVSANGAHVVPLLGGHAGANALARRIAAATGGTAAITTASDARLGIALDEPPRGWRLANPQHAKRFVAVLLEGATVALHDETGAAAWLRDSALPFSDDDAPLRITCTQRPLTGDETHLVFHPRQVVLGVGMARLAAPAEVAALVDQALTDAGLAPGAVAAIGTIAAKADEPALAELRNRLDAPARLFSAGELRRVQAPNPSGVVAAEVGTPSVAEAAALLLAGDGGRLVVEKRKNTVATVAIAEASDVVANLAALPGRARGRLSIVGLGPGDPLMRTAAARESLLAASDWVGYGLYLDLAADLATGKRQHRFDLGAEEARARHAIALAGEGRNVALLCSGDAAIYAMASLVFELLEREEWDDFARRIEVRVIPGITALQAASAATGALIGHDFCAISLSDLMTSWDVIRQRIEAAAAGDFVIAFYNPRSRRRTSQLAEALGILRARRPAATPVLFASRVGRLGETLRITTLAEARAEDADMLSIVLVGNSESRAVEANGRPMLYTPRGYGERSGK